MASESDKKIVVFYVLKVLQEFSDENHPLTYGQILNKLKIIYNIEPDVKSVAKNIETLMQAGYEIIKMGTKGCYLSWRDFNSGELMFLVDAINSSKAIPSIQAKDLISRLTKNCSKFEKKKYIAVQKVDSVIKSKNKELFYVIEVLADAIEQKKKVSFKYNEFKINKELTPRSEGKEFIINPYFMVNSRGKYYLVCNYEKYNTLANYKIECISNIKILNKNVKFINELEGTQNFSMQKYINEHIYMTIGNSVEATIKINNSKNISEIIDWFGEDVFIYEKDNSLFAKLIANELALSYWALQYGENMEIISPISTINLIKKQLKLLNEKYNKGE